MRTPTSCTRSNGITACDGFTLVEVLAALAILSLSAGLVLLGMQRGPGAAGTGALAAEVASLARATRSAAIRSGGERVLSVDLQRRLIGRDDGRHVTLPDGVEIEVVASAGEQSRHGRAGIRFFSDGASTGGTIRLRGVGSVYEVRINWFTGRVVVAPAS